MSDWSIISQTPEIRAIVQEGSLERAFHDALFPSLMFRGEAAPRLFPGNVGDSQTFTRKGMMVKKLKAKRPGIDPTPSLVPYEQWDITIQPYSDTIDTAMPTSAVAIANQFLANCHSLGLSAAESLNDKVRNILYNAALSGQTVADGAQTAVTTLRVKRINGFTRARNPNLAGASVVKFAPVTGSNPLTIRIYDNGGPGYVNRTVTSYTSDNSGDEIGPGTLTLAGGAVTVSDRAVVQSVDRSDIVRVGGGEKVDSITSASLFRLADVRAARSKLKGQNVPTFLDGRYHCHLDTTSQSQLFSDPEAQRLNTSLPDWVWYKDMAVGVLLGCAFFEDTKCPNTDTVLTLNNDGITYSDEDDFAGELYSNGLTTGVKIHRPIFIGQEAIYEHYLDWDLLISEAGLNGKVGVATITNNGIEVPCDRVKIILRAPLDRLQENVSSTWSFKGGWSVGTDATTGGPARYKRVAVVEHGE